jgi:membrane protease YdiL (CAAX protease family)
MKNSKWQIDLLIIIVFFFFLNYLVITLSKSESGIILGQIVNIFGAIIWLIFGIYRITGFKKSNRDVFINIFKNKCSLKCFSLAILVFILSKLTYSFLIEIEFITIFNWLSNILIKPIVLSPESFFRNKLTIYVLGAMLIVIGVFAEELFFRGYLFHAQYKLYGDYTWIINGISWSLIHVFARANVIALLPTAFLLSWIYQRKRNFWIVYGAHLLINAASVYGVIASYRP